MLPEYGAGVAADLLAALGEELEDSFDEAREDGFQTPLYENLCQAMARVLQPVSARSQNSARTRESA